MTDATNHKTEAEKINLSEMGRAKDGRTISSDRRLFVQLLAYGNCSETHLAGCT